MKTKVSRSVSLLPRNADNSTSQTRQLFNMLKGIAFVLVAAALFYLMFRNVLPEAAVASNEQRSASSTLSQSSVKFVADKTTGKVDIEVTGIPSAGQGGLQDDINFATKGDGAIRTVDVDGNKVDRSLVQMAAFENQDFVLPDEAQVYDRKPLVDIHQAPQKSHFRAMTYPLVYSGGELGDDIMRPGSTDLRVNIAATGGRN